MRARFLRSAGKRGQLKRGLLRDGDGFPWRRIAFRGDIMP